MIKKIAILLFAFNYLLSVTGLALNKHYCGEQSEEEEESEEETEIEQEPEEERSHLAMCVYQSCFFAPCKSSSPAS
jgi:hypothetical protein